VIVVTPPVAEWTADIRTLSDVRVTTVMNPDPSRGMFSSIQVGAGAVTGAPIAVLPGDMPFVRAETVRKLLDAARLTGGIVSPRYAGRRGHPIVLSADVCAVLIDADPTTNLNELLRAQLGQRVDLEVDDPGVLRDVDVTEDLA
jgi:molybdenum cofactor cytidylyltransferase